MTLKRKIVKTNKGFQKTGSLLFLMSGKEHYSNKGGHKEKHDFHRDVDKLAKLLGRAFGYNPRPELAREHAFIIRRSMMRNPQDGKR